MFIHTRLILTAIVVSLSLAACGDNAATSPESNTSVSTVSSALVEAGMTEQAVADLLGEASFTQTSNIDELTITHTEWTNDKGTTSVQFHNGGVAYTQFVAATVEN